MATGPLHDEKFASALSDVVWQFHVYGKYKGENKNALKALSKRVPGYTPNIYWEMFESSLQVLIATIETVEDAPKNPKPGQKFSEYADVNLDFVMSKLRNAFPEQDDDFLKSHLGMVIYWYYLR